MDGELITAIAAAGVSGAAAVIAVWQANIAKDSADSAKKQAVAAEEQVILMRRQIEGDEASRKEERGPRFVIESAHTDESDVNVPRGKLIIKQEHGPALASVNVSATGEGVDGMRGAYDSDSYSDYLREQSIEIGPIAAGGTHTVYVDLDYHTRETSIQLHLVCEDQRGEVWERAVGARVAPLPEPERPRQGRSYR